MTKFTKKEKKGFSLKLYLQLLTLYILFSALYVLGKLYKFKKCLATKIQKFILFIIKIFDI
jgi:hypothetical protein